MHGWDTTFTCYHSDGTVKYNYQSHPKTNPPKYHLQPQDHIYTAFEFISTIMYLLILAPFICAVATRRITFGIGGVGSGGDGGGGGDGGCGGGDGGGGCGG